MSRPRTKRTALVILLLLTGGAIINVAVAWGCVLWFPSGAWWLLLDEEKLSPRIHALIPSDWLRQPTSKMESLMIDAEKCEGIGLTIIVVGQEMHQFGAMTLGKDHVLCCVKGGWPFRSLMCHAISNGQYASRLSTTMWVSGRGAVPQLNAAYIDSTWFYAARPLPLRPEFPGFAINTVFYAAVLWLLFAAPGWARRRLRARRGQCPACAYPVGASDVCSECGHNLVDGKEIHP